MDKLADIAAAGLTESPKETVEEGLRLAFFVAGDVLLQPRDELIEFFSRLCMGGFYTKTIDFSNA